MSSLNTGDDKYVMFLDDVIRSGLKEIFFLFDFDEFTAHTIKLTKDAELDIADDISESYIDKLSKEAFSKGNGVLLPVLFMTGICLRIFLRYSQKN